MPRRSSLLVFLALLAVAAACGGQTTGGSSGDPSSESNEDAVVPGPCGETPGHTPTKYEGEPCTQAGLVCGPYRCSGSGFYRIERCLTSPEQVGTECRVAPGYPCALRDHCNGNFPGHGVPYRGYSCLGGRWVDITGIPCEDAGAEDAGSDGDADTH